MTQISREVMTEKDMLELIRAGRTELFGVLLEKYAQKIYGMALRITGNPADAEDILQEVALLAFSKLNTFRGDSAFGTWIYRIALNTTYMKLRERKHLSEAGIEDGLPRFDASGRMRGIARSLALDPEDEAIRNQVAGILKDAIGRLPDDYRVVLIARDIDELSTEETSRALGLSNAAVKSRLHWARLFLRQRLEREFGKRLGLRSWLGAWKM